MSNYLYMSLVELVDNNNTDKNTDHSYLDTYDKLFHSSKFTAKNILEIGMASGGSIRLWYDYFLNAKIYGVDVNPVSSIRADILNKPRIRTYSETNGYDFSFVQREFIDKDIRFDLVVDDGPHTLKSMIQCILLYSELLSDNGILVIEDVQRPEWFEVLTEMVPDELKGCIMLYDLRDIKGRFDDLLFIINKNLLK